MSTRKIGESRVLGSGRSLSPASSPQPKRTSSLLSPTASTTSLISSGSTAHTSPPDSQDLKSRVSLEHNGNGNVNTAAAASASSRLACPICNEEMRHLDDAHKNLEEVRQDEVKDWFRTQVIKARKFQPLAVLNQKLKGLDVFEANETGPPANVSPISSPSRVRSPEPPRPDPDDAVTKNHWQRFGPNDTCSEPMCGNSLNATNGKVSAARTGPGFLVQRFERDYTKSFAEIRKKNVDKTFLEVSRLEKRLSRLTQLLANPPEQTPSGGGLLWSLSTLKTQRKELEQVVCADPRTGCSSEVGFNVAAANTRKEKSDSHIDIDIRMCKECKHTAFSKKDFAAEVSKKPPDVRAYDNLTQFERGIRLLLPKFQHLLTALQDPDKPPTSSQLADASKVRKRLMDSFTQYNIAARRFRDLPTESETQKRLQKAVYNQATNFLHLHMLPLKSLPKVLKHASPNGVPSRMPHSRQNSALAAIKFNDAENASQVSSSSAISALEEEEKSLRERLIVLEEQKFFVGEMVADANKRRKLDEASALSQNLQDLSREIDQIQGQISGLDFEGAYAGNT
ncbi:MAG: hypothetical protein LQ340_001157 [Diploschistes diacapsis]|nr:MAG: hypothetical protein LQ340_001157 [Diploschistes diacapsis]